MPVPSTSVQPARFGPFRVDFHHRELLKNGRKVRLQDQPLQVLAMLLETPKEVLMREELLPGFLSFLAVQRRRWAYFRAHS
jgi:DNA-binding winged helix-turn-helix (wHTH) protein